MEAGLLSLEDVLAESEKLGLEVSERTFRYYAVLGLLPRPVKRPPGSGDARIHFYEQSILDRLRQIRSLQAEGHSLKQVKNLLEAATGQSSMLRAVAEGRFQAACQQYLQAPPTRESAGLFLGHLQKLSGDNAAEPSSREFEACLRQLNLWHAQQQQQAPASGRLQLLGEKVRDLKCQDPRSQRVQVRLIELIQHARLGGGSLDLEILQELRQALM